jgi:hypothetical protein
VLSRKHGAGGNLDDNGAPREDYARAHALQAADKKQQGRAETAGPMCRRTTGEEEGEKGEQGQGDGGGALGVPDGGGGGCEANPGSADTEQTKTRVEPRAGSSKKKPRRVELSTATLTQTQHLIPERGSRPHAALNIEATARFELLVTIFVGPLAYAGPRT